MSEGIEFVVDIQERMEGAVAASAALKKLHADAEKADRGVQGLEGAMKHVTSASHAAAAAHDRHGNSLVNLGHHFEYAKNGLLEFGEAIGVVIAFEAIEKLVDVVKDLGAEILHAAAGAERARVSFEIAFGRPEGNELLEYIEHIGKYTEFTQSQLKGFASELARSGFGVAQVPRALAASLDLAARSPDKLAGVQSAITGLGMIQTTGKVEPRMFRRLGIGEENAPEKFYAELSRRTGKGVEQLKKEIEKGSVPVQDSIEALFTIIAGSRGKLGAAAVEMGKGMEAKITHFKEIPDLIYETVEKSPAFGRFASFIGDLSEKLGPEGPLGKVLATGLGKAFDRITAQLGKITPDEIEHFVEALAKLPGVIVSLTNALLQFVPIADKIVGMGMFGAKGIGSVVGGFLEPIKIGAHLPGTIYDKVKGWFSKTGQAIPEGIAEGVSAPKALERVQKSGAGVSDSAEAGVRSRAEIHSPSKRFERLGRLSADGFAAGLDKGMDDAIDIPALSTSARAVIDGVQPQGGGGGTTNSVSAPVTITINGGDASPQEIADVVHVEVASAILAALEQIALQGGQA